MINIKRNSTACYGCRSCELACSFHHQKVFSPDLSSIKVSRNNRTGKIKWTIDSSCDSCSSETVAMCVRFCAYQALSEVQK